VQLFSDAFGKLLNAVEKRWQVAAASLNPLTYTPPESLAVAMKAVLAEWARRTR
jgi:hypothetical protein